MERVILIFAMRFWVVGEKIEYSCVIERKDANRYHPVTMLVVNGKINEQGANELNE